MRKTVFYLGNFCSFSSRLNGNTQLYLKRAPIVLAEISIFDPEVSLGSEAENIAPHTLPKNHYLRNQPWNFFQEVFTRNVMKVPVLFVTLLLLRYITNPSLSYNRNFDISYSG